MTEGKATTEIDFKALNAVAIKRVSDDIFWGSNYVTVVIYRTWRGDIDSKRFPCCIEEHEKLVKQFRAYMDSK